MQAVSESGVPLRTGTVSFLLTDVEGSTKAWEADPLEMAAAIAAHYAVLDDAISRNGGVRPVEQGEGDSIVAAFARPSDCVATSISLRPPMNLRPGPAIDTSWPGHVYRVRSGERIAVRSTWRVKNTVTVVSSLFRTI